MIDSIAANAAVFLIVAVRCFAFIMTMPLFSMRSVTIVVKVALAGYMAYFMLANVDFNAYSQFISFETGFSMYYVLVLIGEALIGIILGFFVSIFFFCIQYGRSVFCLSDGIQCI